jgi:hypothetical protein
MPPLKASISATIRAGPGYAVAGHPPDVFIEAPAANLETAGTYPAKFFPLSATMALKSPAGPSIGFLGFRLHRRFSPKIAFRANRRSD